MKTITFVTPVGSAFIYKQVGDAYDAYLGTPTKKGTFRKTFSQHFTAEEAQVQWEHLTKNGAQRQA
jgi:hypothetical protein